MTAPKRHHYVPRFILANFVDASGALWVRRATGGPAWSSAPEDVYVERHRYSLIDEQGNKDTRLEGAYAVLESATKPVIDKLLMAARSKTPPNINSGEKAVWDEFLYHQMKRVPAVTDKLAERQSWEDRLENAKEKLLARGVSVDEATLADVRSPKSIARIKQNATVKALAADSPLIRMLLGASSVELGVAPSGEAFVIGSRPIAGADAGLLSAADGSATLWFPIAWDIAVRPIFGGPGKTNVLSPDAVTAINNNSLRQSDFLAGHSKLFVESVGQI